MNKKKRIVLCADDYGQAHAISKAILVLVEQGRLTAVSCLTTPLDWPQHARWIRPFCDQIDLGLHFNLTEGTPQSPQLQQHLRKLNQRDDCFLTLSQLIKHALLGRLDQAAIEAEGHAQLDLFQAAMGLMPRFLDGHQHVHQLPCIRDALLRVYDQRLRSSQSYIRLINPRLKWHDWVTLPKKRIIYILGSKVLKQRLLKEKIPFNQSFDGIYAFSKAKHYRPYFCQFLHDITDHGLIMCHPGETKLAQDPIAAARCIEFAYLTSDQFVEDCKAQAVILTRFLKPL